MSRIDSLQLSKRALGKDYSNASDIKETNRCNNASTNNEKTVLEFKSKCHCLRYLRSRRLEVFGRKKERARKSRPRRESPSNASFFFAPTGTLSSSFV